MKRIQFQIERLHDGHVIGIFRASSHDIAAQRAANTTDEQHCAVKLIQLHAQGSTHIGTYAYQPDDSEEE